MAHAPRRTAALIVSLLVVGLGTAACGGGGSSTTDTTPKVIDVTISGDSVTPNGDTIEVGVNQPIELDVTADSAGEIHVHNGGDGQEFEYSKGSSTISFTIDRPGVVPVEDHALDKTIVQLEAR